MADTEQNARALKKKLDLQKAVLGAVGAAGVLSVALVAPNALKILRMGKGNRFLSYRTQTAFSRLVGKGLIEFSEEGKVRLSKKGELELERKLPKDVLHNPKKWDGQWRVVIFDIPESRRGVRNKLRTMMTEIGFKQLQASVWAFPYDCEELLVLIRTQLKTGRGVQYIVASAIEGDAPLRDHFKLRKT